MSKKYLSHQNFNKNEIQNAVIQVLASDPSTPVEGQIYYNSVSKKKRTFNGTTWDEDGAGGAGDVTQASASWGAGRMKVSGGADKSIVDYATAGIVKSDGNWVVSAATADTDYATPAGILSKLLTGYTAGTNAVITATDSVLTAFRNLQAQITGYAASTKTLTNTTFNANGTGNSISNIETADLASGVLNISTSMAGASDTSIPSSLAIKTYADSLAAANDAMLFKGGIDCSTNPNYPAADAGWTYKVTVAGKIGGASGPNVQGWDTLICTVDATAWGTQAGVGANWVIIQNNLDVATTSTSGYVSALATSWEAESRTDTSKVVTPSSLVNFGVKKVFTIGDASSTSIACTHSLGSKDVIVQVREVSTDAVVECDIVNTSTSVTTLSFTTAPASSSLRVVIIG